jgi:hypothetical protein
MWHEWGKTEMRTGLRQGTVKEREHLEDIGVDWCVIIKDILEKYNKGEWTRLLIIIKDDASCFPKRPI